MNLSSTLNSEIIRIFATILLPGAFTVIVIFVIVTSFQFDSSVKLTTWATTTGKIIGEHSTLTTVFFFIFTVGGGLIAETFGARFEYHICDWRGRANCSEFSSNWNKYLTLKFENDPIGQKYLRYLHLHLKFELNFGCAILLLAFGIATLDCRYTDVSFGWPLYAVMCASAFLLLWEAISTSINLNNVRKQLVNTYHQA